MSSQVFEARESLVARPAERQLVLRMSSQVLLKRLLPIPELALAILTQEETTLPLRFTRWQWFLRRIRTLHGRGRSVFTWLHWIDCDVGRFDIAGAGKLRAFLCDLRLDEAVILHLGQVDGKLDALLERLQHDTVATRVASARLRLTVAHRHVVLGNFHRFRQPRVNCR